MSIRGRILTVMTVALVTGGVSAGGLMLATQLRAQTAAPPAAAPPAAALPAGSIPTAEVPFYAEWASSPHAKRAAEEFNHWNKEGNIPVECARCHSTPGFLDYLGADGSAPGKVDHPAPIGTVITCVACHNDKALTLTSVTFPSGLAVHDQGADARCMTCHQGVESTNSMNKAIAGIADDLVEPKLEFVNVHYAAAGAMLFGTMARVGYQYAGKTYAGRFQHQAPYARCTACHELHTVAVKVNDCAACHQEVTDKASLRKIRVSKIDYDGNGDVNEGIAQEIDHLRDRLLAAIMDYAKAVNGKPVVYKLEVYPYFFLDINANGIADADEARFPNRYKAWTPRLLKAAYNYQFVTKDPGAFAHNSTYAIELLYDSLGDLGGKVSVDLTKAKRP
jgi:Cytochrome c7 and related cytochrome c